MGKKNSVERYQTLVPCTSYLRVTKGPYVKDSVLLEEHAASMGNCLTAFRINVTPSCSRVESSGLLFFKYHS
jgi:hypothetical protein